MTRTLFFLIGFLSSTMLFGQTDQEKKIEEFIQQKGDGFDAAYDKKDVDAYNLLLTEYLSHYGRLSADEKKKASFTLQNIYYNLCCIHSLLNNKAAAITNLKKSIEAGYNNYRHVQADTDLDNIRNEREFIELNKQLRNTGDFLHILKKAGNYNIHD